MIGAILCWEACSCCVTRIAENKGYSASQGF